ncbi:LOW QUALITY PROTEIN: hypothetical protein Cgig2_027267 [Carnegiea gigantea]|uniref:Uncharacterized protein n=1 Tax=Carnegiea gigantea TaxID=171969 RepID=A0A9Q1GJU5_9CARY|nr:LOW QUALITY PROTEIN: hypothetical protein Cgig2_027267 [Carnegiea gigantea]
MVDALKSLMSTTTDAITRQVSDQVKRAMEMGDSARPVHEGEPSHQLEGMSSFHPLECSQAHAQKGAIGFLLGGKGACGDGTCRPIRTRDNNGVSNYLYPLCNALQADRLARGAGSGRTKTEHRELKKALHELVDKGQIDRFLKRGPRFLRQE